MEKIQVVDISPVSLEKEDVTLEDVEAVGNLIKHAFQEIGFVYIKNHGVAQEVIDAAFRASLDFFSLDTEAKAKITKGIEFQGWVCEGREIFDQDEEGNIAEHEIREAYDLKNISPEGIYPDENSPSLRPALIQLSEESKKLAYRLLECISVALSRDKEFLSNIHQGMLSQGIQNIDNASTLRSIHYPPIGNGLDRQGAVRCGEHSDYGTITLLYQDDMGGLEVKSVQKTWVSAHPVPGTILINVGDLLENLTCGEFPATRHRVRIPEEEITRQCRRQSVVFFVHPDNAVVCSPLSGPDPRYPPVTAKQHLDNRYSATYGARLLQ